MTSDKKKMKALKADNQLNKQHILIYVALILFYILVRLQDISVLLSFPGAIFPLNSIYIANNLLFLNDSLNAGLLDTVITPSNGSLIYPPGIYILTKFLGSVRNIYIFLFLGQVFVPLLIFNFLYRRHGRGIAMACSALSVCYLTNVNWWAPDFIIQPLMLTAILLMLVSIDDPVRKFKPYMLCVAGILSGTIMLLKHNIGLFFAILCITMIFFRSQKEVSGKNEGISKLLSLLIVGGYLAFGVIFYFKTLYFDEVIFYLLPYLIFWIAIGYCVARGDSFSLDIASLFKNVSIFVLSMLILPVSVFLWIGDAVGYGRYFHSLFGMGFDYLAIWDHGILGILKQYTSISSITNIKAIYRNILSIIYSILFTMPLLVNSVGAVMFVCAIRYRTKLSVELKKYAEIISMGIIGMFMFYPLEGYHILSTKLFLFIFILSYILKPYIDKWRLPVAIVLITLIVPHVLNSFIKLAKLPQIATSYGSETLQRVIALPIEKRLSEELDKQVATIQRSVGGHKYYVLDSTGTTLTSLLAIVNNKYPQYYLEMRKGILNKEVIAAIKGDLTHVPYVIVNKNDFERYENNTLDDPYLSDLLAFTRDNFQPIDVYEAPKEWYQSAGHQALSFKVFKSNYILVP